MLPAWPSGSTSADASGHLWTEDPTEAPVARPAHFGCPLRPDQTWRARASRAARCESPSDRGAVMGAERRQLRWTIVNGREREQPRRACGRTASDEGLTAVLALLYESNPCREASRIRSPRGAWRRSRGFPESHLNPGGVSFCGPLRSRLRAEIGAVAAGQRRRRERARCVRRLGGVCVNQPDPR